MGLNVMKSSHLDNMIVSVQKVVEFHGGAGEIPKTFISKHSNKEGQYALIDILKATLHAHASI